MKLKKTKIITVILVSIVLFFVFFEGDPSIRFCNEWHNDLNNMWENSWQVIHINELQTNSFYGKKGKYFTMIIKGKLPLGKINIKAVLQKGSNRKTAFIFPDIIKNEDPEANLTAIAITVIKESGLVFKGEEIMKGRYYIYFEKDSKEIANTELLIL